jgi:hypothetical protein
MIASMVGSRAAVPRIDGPELALHGVDRLRPLPMLHSTNGKNGAKFLINA